MQTSLSQHMGQRQSLVMAPHMRQSLKILQVAALDLRTAIAEELEANPVLEELPMESVSLDRSDAPKEPDTPDAREELSFDREFEVLSRMGEDFNDSFVQNGDVEPYNSDREERRAHFFDSFVGEVSLQQHLMEQGQLLDCTEVVKEALRFLIGSLNDHGFLTSPLSDLALAANLPLEAVQEAKKLLNSFEPLGIGAVDLRECLLLQLQVKGRGGSIAGRIVRDHFQLLTRRRLQDIARRMGIDIVDIQRAIEEIGALDPAPGRRFAEDNNRIVVPDVTVEKVGGEWTVTLNSDYIPKLRLSRTYKDLIAKGTLSPEERTYLRTKLYSGKFLINSIDLRQRTIERITRELLKAQADFFEEGITKLHPLTMRQIADILGVHETTISRAVANKYMRTPHGIFELKFFFTSGYQSEGGEIVANTSVKDMLKGLIQEESSLSPLSDMELAKQLSERCGVQIARRTVAKYRDELGIAPSNLRRRF